MILKTANFPFNESNFYLQITNGRDPFTILHSHEFYEIMCVISGNCRQTINSKPIHMRQHSVCLLRPGDTHKIISQTPGTNMMSLSVKTECVDAFLNAYGKVVADLILHSTYPPYIDFDSQASNYISDAYTSLASSNPDDREMYCNILLGKVLHSLSTQKQTVENYKSTGTSHTKTLLLDVLNQMNNPENIAEGISALQRLSGYSRPQLCRLMKKHLNQTPYEYIHKLRMNYAYNLLTHTGLSVSTIAEQAGFSSTSYFISAFKEQFSMTPLQLRKDFYTPAI